jgi:cation/acetate symporter
VNFAVAFAVSKVTAAPPLAVRQLVENIRTPDHAPQAHDVELVIHDSV